jgi:hypothetical protein
LIDDVSNPSFHADLLDHGPSVIVEDDNSSVGNIYCFAAFADKRTGVLYNDLTGSFPYMSLEGNVCYLIVYHYESNAILGTPISGFDDNTVFAAYKTQFEFLESKGYMLVEPHNHRVNAAERAIQTFKDHFISALATTDSEFPLQLWDKLTSQVVTTLNLIRAYRINPRISAYEAIWDPYNWNCFPLAPPGCKAVIYESPAARDGAVVEWRHGTSAHRLTITGAITTSSQKHEHIAYPVRQSYSPNTARSHSCQHTII